MNGNDLLAYSQMKQHQNNLLREAEGLHLARSVRRARQLAAAGEAPSIAIHPNSIGVLRPSSGSTARVPRSDSLARVHNLNGVTPRQKVRPNPTPLRRLAARLGTSLVGVGRRLERIDK